MRPTLVHYYVKTATSFCCKPKLSVRHLICLFKSEVELKNVFRSILKSILKIGHIFISSQYSHCVGWKLHRSIWLFKSCLWTLISQFGWLQLIKIYLQSFLWYWVKNMKSLNYRHYHQLKKLERFDWLMSRTFFLYFWKEQHK